MISSTPKRSAVRNGERTLLSRGGEVRRREVGEPALRVVLGLAGDSADLVEGARIEQTLDALAHRELAAVMLALDLVGPAHAAPSPRVAAVRRSRVASSSVSLPLFTHATGFPPSLAIRQSPRRGRRPLWCACPWRAPA